MEDKWFVNEEELKATALKWYQTMGTQFHMDGMNTALACYQKCSDWNCDYVEK